MDELLGTAVDPTGDAFARNEKHHHALVDELLGRLREASRGGSEESRERHVARGKLLPRDRVDLLLDPGSPFLELSPPAANGLYDDEAPGAGIITGIGRVSGRECVVVVNDATPHGGGDYPPTLTEKQRAQEAAPQ